jgi:hypothetical protein
MDQAELKLQKSQSKEKEMMIELNREKERRIRAEFKVE